MAQASSATRSRNGTPVQAVDRRQRELARTIDRKLAQGFEVESSDETSAVLVMKGRSRWFGLSNTESVRYEVTIDEAGKQTSRRL